SAPHEWLFPQCACCVHHGGIGTTQASLSAGVPTVVTPVFADQKDIAKKLSEDKTGQGTVHLSQLTAAELGAKIRKCCDDPTIRQNCEKLREVMQKEDGVGTTVQFLEGFMKEVESGVWKKKQDALFKRCLDAWEKQKKLPDANKLMAKWNMDLADKYQPLQDYTNQQVNLFGKMVELFTKKKLWWVKSTQGCLARKGEALKSEECGRYKEFTLLEELEANKSGSRLRVRRLKGVGPDEAWVSPTVSGKDIIVKVMHQIEIQKIQGDALKKQFADIIPSELLRLDWVAETLAKEEFPGRNEKAYLREVWSLGRFRKDSRDEHDCERRGFMVNMVRNGLNTIVLATLIEVSRLPRLELLGLQAYKATCRMPRPASSQPNLQTSGGNLELSALGLGYFGLMTENGHYGEPAVTCNAAGCSYRPSCACPLSVPSLNIRVTGPSTSLAVECSSQLGLRIYAVAAGADDSFHVGNKVSLNSPGTRDFIRRERIGIADMLTSPELGPPPPGSSSQCLRTDCLEARLCRWTCKMEAEALIVKLPTDFAGWAISFRGEEHRREKGEAGPLGGRGQGIHLHAATTAAKFRMDGPKDNMAIRKHGDEDLAMEVAHRKMIPNSDVTFWCVGLHEPHREWACRFCMNDDGTISPCDKGKPCKDVVIGVHLGEGWKRTGLVLVHREDTKRRLVFFQGSELKAHVADLDEAASRVDATKEHRLIITAPNLPWIGPGPLGLCIRDSMTTVANGRIFNLKVGKAADAAVVAFDGLETECMAVRLHEDREFGFEVAHRKMEPGSGVILWDCDRKHRAVQFAFAADRSLCPFGFAGVAIGIKPNMDRLELVRSDDPMRLRFQTPEEEEATAKLLREEAAAAKAALAALEDAALARCNAEMFERLRLDGFVHIPNVVPRELVLAARKEINRQLGTATGGTDQFKAKTFPRRPEITNLVNSSGLPIILRRLLGPRDSGPYRVESGQIALRFPGDMCIKDSVESDFQNFERIRQGWHIDGTPSSFIPGVTDHWGKITNFDALVGVLLSDTDANMSGELCCYPGSHMDLAGYFKQNGLDDVANKGAAGLPTGQKTDSVLRKPLIHCNGKAGDVFLANYMVAHFIAPNTSQDIRYAVYFRIRGPSFDLDPLNKESMLDPLMNWSLDGPQPPKKPSAKPSLRRAATIEDAELMNEVLDYYSAANNDHTVPT
ncbi:ATG26, partial [Symbiodinium sp. KB8]